MVVKSTDRRKLLSIFFYNDIDSLERPFLLDVSRREREKQIAPPSVLLSNKALYQSVREKSLSYCENFQYMF